HTTGIPHSPMGQAIVEHAHRSLKAMLQKQKRGEDDEASLSIHQRLWKALHTLNHLTIRENATMPILLNPFLSLQTEGDSLKERAKVYVKNLQTQAWEGPWD
ncbi:POK18 protein, partial [Calyptomena viridis]|nr:POK18 protein [Calyptomena viridis]